MSHIIISTIVAHYNIVSILMYVGYIFMILIEILEKNQLPLVVSHHKLRRRQG